MQQLPERLLGDRGTGVHPLQMGQQLRASLSDALRADLRHLGAIEVRSEQGREGHGVDQLQAGAQPLAELDRHAHGVIRERPLGDGRQDRLGLETRVLHESPMDPDRPGSNGPIGAGP